MAKSTERRGRQPAPRKTANALIGGAAATSSGNTRRSTSRSGAKAISICLRRELAPARASSRRGRPRRSAGKRGAPRWPCHRPAERPAGSSRRPRVRPPVRYALPWLDVDGDAGRSAGGTQPGRHQSSMRTTWASRMATRGRGRCRKRSAKSGGWGREGAGELIGQGRYRREGIDPGQHRLQDEDADQQVDRQPSNAPEGTDHNAESDRPVGRKR